MPAGQNPTSQVTLQLTGTSSVPNNFTVDVYSWDVITDAAVYNRTIVTGLTRTATSAINGGSLTVSPYYEITGITGTDNYVKLTSTTTCTTTATQDITSAALTAYVPPTVNENFSTPSTYDTFALNGSTLASGNHQVATIDTLSYLSASDFSLTYTGGTYVTGGATVTGAYANGPFSSFSITKTGKTFSLMGSVNTSLTGVSGVNIIIGRMKLTYNPSGGYVVFNYYYNPYST